MFTASRVSSPAFRAASSPFSSLKRVLSQKIPRWEKHLRDLKEKYGDKEIQKIKVEQVLGGSRGLASLLYNTSALDPRTGITFRGYSIQEIAEFLPKAKDGPDGEGDEPLPESLFWVLLTGEFPTPEEFEEISKEFKSRAELGDDLKQFIKDLPVEMHAMTQLSSSLLYLQPTSKFVNAVLHGTHKEQLWEYTLEDALDLLAKIPRIAAFIYRHKYKENEFIEPNLELDWAGNFAHMMGYKDFEMRECLRGYLAIHSDHEGGNVSAHTTHLLGTALADPYLAYAGGINGLAGPLHGLANQEVLKWLMNLKNELGDNITDEKIKDYVLNTLSEGKVVPGYGHAVLRHTDPRFLHQKAFAEKFIKGDPLVSLVRKCYRVVPGILRTLGKVKNPWPNVDAHSGVLLNHYGLKEYDYYTVVFAVSRALGCMANLILARGVGVPLERPQSVNLDWIETKIKEDYI